VSYGPREDLPVLAKYAEANQPVEGQETYQDRGGDFVSSDDKRVRHSKASVLSLRRGIKRKRIQELQYKEKSQALDSFSVKLKKEIKEESRELQ